MKTCSHCKAEKPLTEYHKNRSAKDGLQHICISCRRCICAEYVSKNREKVNSWARGYAARNHDKVLAAKKVWADQNIDHVKKYARRYIKNHSEKCNARNRNESEVLADNYIYRLLVPIIGVDRSDIPLEMIEVKRLHLQIVRKLKELKA